MTPWDFVNSITHNKKNLFEETPEESRKDYSPYIINKALSFYPDCVLLANEINMRHGVDSELQFNYYLNSIRPMKRYSKWIKRVESEDIESVKKYLNCSTSKAKQALKTLTDAQIKTIKQRYKGE